MDEFFHIDDVALSHSKGRRETHTNDTGSTTVSLIAINDSNDRSYFGASYIEAAEDTFLRHGGCREKAGGDLLKKTSERMRK
jgi:hypothetical protein